MKTINEKNLNIAQSLRDMEIGESRRIGSASSIDHNYLRVPGGWIVTLWAGSSEQDNGHSVFVPIPKGHGMDETKTV